MRRRLAIVTVLALLGVTIVTAVPDASAGDVRRPSGRLQGSFFQLSTPEAQGMNSSRLADGIDFLVAHKEVFRIHSVVVLRNGTIVLDARFYPFGSRQRHSVASVTKSVTSTLIGIAIDEGYIKSVDERVIDFFPDHTIDNLDDRKRSMTIENLLTMRSGFACDPANSEATLTEMTNSPNWVLSLAGGELPATIEGEVP